MIAHGRDLRAFVVAFLLMGCLVSVPSQATPIPLPGFPVKVDGIVREPVALADVDHDGSKDLIVAYETKVAVVSSDGRIAAGWPVDLAALSRRGNVRVVGPPAVGDIDGDGKLEIALAVSYGIEADGGVIVLKGDGQLLWQVPIPSGVDVGCTLADLTGRHADDVIVGTRGGELLALDAAGKTVRGFPVRIGAPVTSPISFGGLARGQPPVLAVGANDGKVYVISASGAPVPGFPLVTHFVVSGAPAFADLDGDGQGDLIVASQDFSVYAVKANGEPIPGFPVAAQERINGGPAIGDIDHDGKLDVVVASADGKVYAWDNKGHLFPHFPVSAGTKINREVSVVLADSTRTGKDSIFVTSADGNLYAFDGTGAPLDGFPLPIGSDFVTAPVIGDVVPDPSEELIIGTNGAVQGYRLDRSGPLPQSPLSWPAPGHDSTRESHFGPNPPHYQNAVLTPSVPRRGELLKLTYEYYSLDGTPEPATRIRWMLNGKEVPEFDGHRSVPGAQIKRGDRWQATIQAPSDYALYKDGPGATIVRSPEVAVPDTPPTEPRIALAESTADGAVHLRVKILAGSSDADGDPVTYTYRWIREGHSASTAPELDGRTAHKGQKWRVIVTPTDGVRAGTPAEAEITLPDTPPTRPTIALSPEHPTIEDDVKVSVVTPAHDADQDTLTYRYAFYLNGQLLALPPERGYLPKGVARHGDVVKVVAWANDGEKDGPSTSAETRIVDAPPRAPRIAIAPSTPHTGDTLSVGLIEPARDPDRDPVSYRIQWEKDGLPFGVPGQLTIPGQVIHKGQRWSVQFEPSDGTLQGPVARAQVLIGNEAPTRPTLKVSNRNPFVTETSIIDIVRDSVDPDGDRIKYEVAWSVDGKPAFLDQASTVAERIVKLKASVAMPASKTSADTHKRRRVSRRRSRRKHETQVLAAVPPAGTITVPVIGKMKLRPGEFRKHQRILVRVTAIDSDGARSPAGTIEIVPRNTPPGSPKIALEPSLPTIESGLRAVVTSAAPDRDGDTIVYHYKWFRDDVEATDIGNRATLKPGEIKHGEWWRVVVRAFDGEAEGPPVEATVTVRNTPPVAPQIALVPAHPTVVTGLTCNTLSPATDADHDPLTLRYEWFRNGKPFAVPANEDHLSGEAMRAGQTWRCEATAFDGEADSGTVSATAVIEDAVPSTPVVGIFPRTVRAGTPLVCTVNTEAIDPDGDRVTYDFQWQPPAGQSVPPLKDPARIPPGVVRKGGPWRCVVTASDGRLQTPAATATVQVANTPPVAPEVVLLPAQPEEGGRLQCRFSKPAFDADGDSLLYAFTWYRNGVVQPFAPESADVPGRLVKAGDRWSCSVVVNDGTDSSPSAQSPEFVVQPRPRGSEDQ